MGAMDTVPALCRDCLTAFVRPIADAGASAGAGAGAGAGPGAGGPARCPACRSPRLLAHPELDDLAIAHIDCDAFFASVEKRDDPGLRDRPVIVGGGRRGVVSTACYLARLSGVRSAMPMFEARRLCPEAVVLAPRMARYAEVSRQIRALMAELTPLVEPLSLDEAFLDLAGTGRLHRATPALMMARLQARIEAETGVTTSVGLSHNKFLAKIASDLQKPRGFAVIGRAETDAFLRPRPLSLIWGVGAATLHALEAAGLRTIGDLCARDHKWLAERFGAQGDRVWRLAHGEDARPVSATRPPRSLSAETTFEADLADLSSLSRHLWDLAETLSARVKAKDLAGRTVTLKLRRSDFRLLTRRQTLGTPTQMADRMYAAALPLLQRETASGPFRLLGIGLSSLTASPVTADIPDLLDTDGARRIAVERAVDAIRKRFGGESIRFGRSVR